MNLITTFYISKKYGDKDRERNSELEKCLHQNATLGFFKRIVLLMDEDDAIEKVNDIKHMHSDYVPIDVIKVNKIPTYSDFLSTAFDKYPNSFCMISNADIWLKEYHSTDKSKMESADKLVLCLTRHEYDMSKPLIDDYYLSHDSFIFSTKDKFFDDNELHLIEHTQDNWGVENEFIHFLKDKKMECKNPCLTTIIVHEHKSGVRPKDRKYLPMKSYIYDGVLPDKC